jgi:hypothetical protein
LIAPDQCVFCTGHFPHPLNSKKPADDFLYRESPAIFYLLEIISQAREVEKGTFYFSGSTQIRVGKFCSFLRPACRQVDKKAVRILAHGRKVWVPHSLLPPSTA